MFFRSALPVLGIVVGALTLSIAVAFNFDPSSRVNATSCGGCVSTRAEAFENAKYVFLGRVLSQETMSGYGTSYECDGPRLLEIQIPGLDVLELNRFHVESVWKGTLAETITVAGKLGCGYSFSVGEMYIVYVDYTFGVGIPFPQFCAVTHVPETGASTIGRSLEGTPRPGVAEHLEFLGEGRTPVPGSAVATPTPWTPKPTPTCPTPVPTVTLTSTVTPTHTLAVPTPTLAPPVAATFTSTPAVDPTPTISPTTVPTPTLTTTIVPTYAPTIAVSPTALPSPADNGTCGVSDTRIDLTVLVLVGLVGAVGVQRLSDMN